MGVCVRVSWPKGHRPHRSAFELANAVRRSAGGSKGDVAKFAFATLYFTLITLKCERNARNSIPIPGL